MSTVLTAAEDEGMPQRPELFVTHHAQAQAQQRHRDFYVKRGVGGIYAEVLQGIREGRKAKTVPRWAVIATRRSKAYIAWYVWNAEMTRCYVIARGRHDRHRGAKFVVITVLRGRDPVPA